MEVIKESEDERINAACRNASLNNLPRTNNTGVSTAVDKIKLSPNALSEDALATNLYNNFPTPPSIIVPPAPEPAGEDKEDDMIDDNKAAEIEEAVLGSTIIDGRHCSTQQPQPTGVTKVSFNNKSYSDGTYKDGTVHITINADHDADHPSPVDPDPHLHVLGIALLHYTSKETPGVALAQPYSFNAGIKKFGDIGKKAAMTKLVQLNNYKTCKPLHANSITPAD